MVAVAKVIGVLSAVIVGLLATLFGVASGVAMGTRDEVEHSAMQRSMFWSFVVLMICGAIVVGLTGCAELKYAECLARDGTSRPCQ